MYNAKSARMTIQHLQLLAIWNGLAFELKRDINERPCIISLEDFTIIMMSRYLLWQELSNRRTAPLPKPAAFRTPIPVPTTHQWEYRQQYVPRSASRPWPPPYQPQLQIAARPTSTTPFSALPPRPQNEG